MGDIIKLEIENYAAGGEGLAKADGKTVFVEGGIPGETAVCRVTEGGGSWARAQILEITKASPLRAEPECQFYGRCGGCNMQHVQYQSQIEAKTAMLKDACRKAGGVKIAEPKTAASPPWEYRNRMQFHAIRGRDENAYGLKAKKSEEVVPITDCPVADPGIRALLQAGSLQAGFLQAGFLQAGFLQARAFFVSPEKDRQTVYSRGGLLLSEFGRHRGKTPLLGREIAIDAGVFFQSNGAMLEALAGDLAGIAAALPKRARARPMADIYCGVGTFAAILADLFPAADLIEENRAALALARENVKTGAPLKFHPMRADIWAKTARLDGYGLAVADPPRQGLSPVLAGRFAKNGPDFLAYISCNPASFARDSKILSESYDLEELRLYDFYPQTAHIESLALFVKKRAV